ncbi:MAG: transcriptional activator NhaR [Deltaproteobacteria bacterium]|nr:transcriptional activator NhaR [Deltaproteobacteria bacterium]
MEWLNYHHLLYFWVVAKEGGLAPAGKVLRLAHPTLSGQIHALEEALGEKLFERSGRRLALTEVGRVVFRYADEIFSLGQELMETVRGRPTGQPVRLRVGISDALSKVVVARILAPALALPEPVRLTCVEDDHERLLSSLSTHSVDVILSDSPVAPGSPVRAFGHLLGECGVSFFATPELLRNSPGEFPGLLDGAPVLMPLENQTLRRGLEHWFSDLGIRPRLVAEFEDSALEKMFGSTGLGFFPGPTVVAREIERQYGVRSVGRTDTVKERFYAISAERRLKNPAVVAISSAAKARLFEAKRAK